MSASIIGLPFTFLLIIANSVSKIGKPRDIIGMRSTITVVVFIVSIEIPASIKPKNSEPQSPIKVFAGLKLNGKNPNAAPAIASIRTEVPGFPLTKAA